MTRVGGRFRAWRRERALSRVEPGDGRELKRFRWWQWTRRALFHVRLSDDGRQPVYSVDVKHGKYDSNGRRSADLYLDGRHHAVSSIPARFPVPGGTIEVAASGFGLKRCHYVTAEGAERRLAPDPASAEGRRLRFEREHPTLSHWMGAGSVSVLLVALLVLLTQIVGSITRVPEIAEHLGTFSPPVELPVWANITVTAAAALASTERALRLRYSRLLDGAAG
ncbi:hypothetical protein GCM10009676_31800 [Prauserella halophila]|uniref:PEGA domain-containing protein n=1 Tax=Prauserella halophila TaxID=185641 RepID=A0ABN1WEX3_9PSEU|nr:hypothetical protein [Prauserella halophila]MCP2236853.1 hypothetical protein [Prauserella halophila]